MFFFLNDLGVRAPEAINKDLRKKKISGALPLGRFYPELKDCMLLCATEMSKRADMDALVAATAAKPTRQEQAQQEQEVIAGSTTTPPTPNIITPHSSIAPLTTQTDYTTLT